MFCEAKILGDVSRQDPSVVILGPTGSGKTGVSIEIAKALGGEIISADSMQIYKGIHIASAAPNREEKQGIPHHLIEFLELTDTFSVADYVKKAREIIKDIASRGKTPIIVGGTGLYVSSLLQNTEYIEEKTDLQLRQKLEKEFDDVGGEEMLNRLASIDSETAERLHPNDKKRIVRAFEVYYSTGKTITEQNILSHKQESDFDALIIGITYKDREKLYERINLRVDLMLKNGLLNEAETTFENKNKSGAFQAIGHKELYPYLSGDITLNEAAELLKQQTRRYAKRQLTWFRRDENIHWIYADECESVFSESQKLIDEYLI